MSIDLFSYPYGGGNSEPKKRTEYLLKEIGYKCALKNNPGINKYNQNPFCLYRINVFGGENLLQFKSRIHLANLIHSLK